MLILIYTVVLFCFSPLDLLLSLPFPEQALTEEIMQGEEREGKASKMGQGPLQTEQVVMGSAGDGQHPRTGQDLTQG